MPPGNPDPRCCCLLRAAVFVLGSAGGFSSPQLEHHRPGSPRTSLQRKGNSVTYRIPLLQMPQPYRKKGIYGPHLIAWLCPHTQSMFHFTVLISHFLQTSVSTEYPLIICRPDEAVTWMGSDQLGIFVLHRAALILLPASCHKIYPWVILYIMLHLSCPWRVEIACLLTVNICRHMSWAVAYFTYGKNKPQHNHCGNGQI